MYAHRKLALVAAAGVAPFLLSVLAAAPASAHGSLQNPVSRAAACGPEGGQAAQSAACQAASAASGPNAFAEWDNIRVPNVAGRDRELIPDGKLCSAGIPQFRGLDQPRADWPTSKLSSGSDFTFTYRGTIPHAGTFRFYVTKDGYDPAQPLVWSDLESEPFLTATDPVLDDGSYAIDGSLPPGKSGRHLIYTIWQNSSSPDTYYSCSDVVFAGAGNAAGQATAESTAGVPVQPLEPAEPAQRAVPAVPAVDAEPASAAGGQSKVVPLAVGGAAILAAAGGAVVILRRRRALQDGAE